MKKYISIFLSILIIFSFQTATYADSDFSDVPKNSYAYESINQLRKLGITDGIGSNNFGYGKAISKKDFAEYLIKLLDLKSSNFEQELLDNSAITNERAVCMIIEALEYSQLAQQLEYMEAPFSDVTDNKEYITMAKDFGIIKSSAGSLFKPDELLLREKAAFMLMETYKRLNQKIDFINGFYAIRSSDQIDLIKELNSVSFGWSRLEFVNNRLRINTSSQYNNEYYIPSGYEKPFNYSKGRGNKNLLMVAVEDKIVASNVQLSTYIMTNESLRKDAVKLIVEGMNMDGIKFDGIVADFENMKGEDSKSGYNDFLYDLKSELDKTGKLLYVAVPPQRKDGIEYFDGYDYRTIGDIADKVILMAHDYNAKSLTEYEMENGFTTTPVAPIDEIYYALKMITDRDTGIRDINKVLLQISFSTAQWKLKDGKVINQKPYSPNYDTLSKRIEQGVELNYSTKYESPYITFYDEDDSTDNIVWYENNQSVAAKLKLAKMLGVTGISVWRLGNIPMYENGQNIIWDR